MDKKPSDLDKVDSSIKPKKPSPIPFVPSFHKPYPDGQKPDDDDQKGVVRG